MHTTIHSSPCTISLFATTLNGQQPMIFSPERSKQTHLPTPSPFLLADPAFSTDPLSHPYFVTSQQLAPPPVGHPVLKNRNRGTNNTANPSDINDVGLRLPGPPPNSPITPRASPYYLHHTTVLTSPDILSSASTPVVSRVNPVSTPQGPPVAPLPSIKAHRKRLGFLSRRMSAQPQVADSLRKPSEVARPPPDSVLATKETFDERFAPCQSPPRVRARNSRHVRRMGTPNLTSTSASNGLQADRLTTRLQDLDRIDELDETNPLGVALHHGGPYEAAVQIIKDTKRVPLGFLNNTESSKYHNHALRANGNAYIPPQAPPGVSLNLSPGQVLPHNFHVHYGQGDPPIWGQISASKTTSRRNSTIPRPRHLTSLPQPRPAREKEASQTQPPQPSSTTHEDSSFRVGMAMLEPDSIDLFPSSPLPSTETLVEDFNPYDPAHLLGEYPRTPSHPRHSVSDLPIYPIPCPAHPHDSAMSAATTVENPLQAKDSVRPPSNTPPVSYDDSRSQSHSPVSQEDAQTGPQPQSLPFSSASSHVDVPPPGNSDRTRLHSKVPGDSKRPPMTPRNGMEFPLGGASGFGKMPHSLPPGRGYLWPPPSVARSDRSTGTSSSSSQYGSKPPTRHLPKHLVMPALLSPGVTQRSRGLPKTPSLASDITAGYVYQGPHPTTQLPQPIRPRLQPPTLRTHGAPMAASKKLKKRMTMTNVVAPVVSPSEITTVSFAPPIIGFHPAAPIEKALARARTEKIPKRVLSKRKTYS